MSIDYVYILDDSSLSMPCSNGDFNPRQGVEMRDCDPKTKACMGKIYDDSNCRLETDCECHVTIVFVSSCWPAGAEMLTPNGKRFIHYHHLLEVAKARDEISSLWRGWHMKGAIAPDSPILDGDWKEV